MGHVAAGKHKKLYQGFPAPNFHLLAAFSLYKGVQ
jgi:hypothetical protein